MNNGGGYRASLYCPNQVDNGIVDETSMDCTVSCGLYSLTLSTLSFSHPPLKQLDCGHSNSCQELNIYSHHGKTVTQNSTRPSQPINISRFHFEQVNGHQLLNTPCSQYNSLAIPFTPEEGVTTPISPDCVDGLSLRCGRGYISKSILRETITYSYSYSGSYIVGVDPLTSIYCEDKDFLPTCESHELNGENTHYFRSNPTNLYTDESLACPSDKHCEI